MSNFELMFSKPLPNNRFMTQFWQIKRYSAVQVCTFTINNWIAQEGGGVFFFSTNEQAHLNERGNSH